MVDGKPDSADIQAGLGFAAFLIVSTLLAKLADCGALTRDQLSEILDHALLNAETHQTGSPISNAHVVARKAIKTLLEVSDMKRNQKRTPQ